MHDQLALRVPCPSCAEWALLRVFLRPGTVPQVVAFSCRNQTEATHLAPTTAELQTLVNRHLREPAVRATAQVQAILAARAPS